MSKDKFNKKTKKIKKEGSNKIYKPNKKSSKNKKPAFI
jgi:hypothetical protein